MSGKTEEPSLTLLIPPPANVVWYLRPMLWLTWRITGKDPLPARLLTYFPKGAVGAGVLELTAAGGADLDARCLAVARIVASTVSGCPFCVDMNWATWKRAGLRAEELPVLFGEASFDLLGAREAVAARYAKALEAQLILHLHQYFTPRELVVLATTIAQVNFWTRYNQGLGVPAAGFFDDSVCRLPEAAGLRAAELLKRHASSPSATPGE